MVLQKRLEYGFNGYQVPATPRATRSARRRSKFRSRLEDNQLCAFELLATVAGKLLQEKDTSTASGNKSAEKYPSGFVKEECQDKNKPLKPELSDEGSCDQRRSSVISSHSFGQNCTLKQFLDPENGSHSGFASGLTSSSCSERLADERFVNDKNHNEIENLPCKIELGATMCGEVSGCKLDGDISKMKDELHKIGKMPNDIGAEMCSFEGQSDEKPPSRISSGGNSGLSGHDDNISCSSLSPACDNVPVVSRDDDEKFSVCTHPSITKKSFRPMSHIGDRRIRKIIASKYWRAGPQSKVDTLSNNDRNLKPIYPNRKNLYKCQRSQMNIPFKKRKLFDHDSVSNSDRCQRLDGICCSPEKGMNQDTSDSSPRMYRASGMSSFEARQHTALQSGDSHVKLRIKSLRVPELFIEISETATIGNLKRTVMEAVTAILGGGLRVGVILQGKKVRDDNRTLLQTGISHDNQLDALGFTLEPNSSQSFPPTCATDTTHVPCADMPRPLTRNPCSPVVNHLRIQGSPDMLPEHEGTNLGNFVESDHDSAPSPPNTSVNNGSMDSNALVPVPEMGVEALAVVPVHQKSKRSEMVQRRIRRPFSVAEVEALVQAVEELGTGRWRDVKLHAFDNAKHRTYVDLKDKWKTLVHTARISPQQRRGEPMPQELLDRVLTAHAYWSQQQQQQQQTKQQPKQPCLLL